MLYEFIYAPMYMLLQIYMSVVRFCGGFLHCFNKKMVLSLAMELDCSSVFH